MWFDFYVLVKHFTEKSPPNGKKFLPGLGHLPVAWTIWPLGVVQFQGEALTDDMDTQVGQAQPCSDPTGDRRRKSKFLDFSMSVKSEELLHPLDFTPAPLCSKQSLETVTFLRSGFFVDLMKCESLNALGGFLTSSVAYWGGQQTPAICFCRNSELRMDFTILNFERKIIQRRISCDLIKSHEIQIFVSVNKDLLEYSHAH